MFPCLQQLLSMSRDKSARLTQLHSQVDWLGRYNASLVAQLNEANTRADQVSPLEARIRGLELELARAHGKCDAQRAVADQKAQEAEAHEAKLRRAAAALE